MKKLSLVLSLLMAASYSYAGTDGGSAASFLRLGSGAKASGMGEAYSTITEGPDSLYYNPGGVVFAEGKKISFNHMSYIESTSYDTLYYSQKIKEGKAFGMGLQYFSYGSINETDLSGTKIGSYSPKDLAFSLGYSLKIKSKYSLLNGGGVGVSVKYVNLKIKDSATAFASDIGFLTPVINKKFRAGFVIQNIGTKIKFDSEKEKLPLTFKTGFSYIPFSNLITSLDMVLPNDSDFYFSLGTAYRKKFSEMNMVLRAGYNGLNSDVSGFSGFNFGVGFEFSKISIDYAFMPYGDMGEGHRIGLSFAF
ncbi:MAG TPA: PorV/PorQ family protein [Elusimicrobiales bacterium]|nr:PorV/PorQ family protein [Elusimicrobiales bacterium]